MKYILAAVLLLQASCALGASESDRITGGENAFPGEYPYHVSILYGVPPLVQPKPACGGSIINKRWILTSASCLSLIPSVGKVQVKVGKYELNKDGEYVQTADVLLHIIHKDYRGLLQLLKPYDIGLLKLETELKLNARVKAVQFPKVYTRPEGKANLTGWGSISTNIIPINSEVLQAATVTLLIEENCEDALRSVAPTESITDLQFCSGPLDTTVSACAGDSGDPLVQVDELGNPVQIGITSWSPYPCGATGSPTVYTLLSAMLYWIEEKIAEN